MPAEPPAAPALRVHAAEADPLSANAEAPRGPRVTDALSRAVAFVRGEVADLANAYHRFFFAPSRPHALAAIRILGGGMMLYSALVWGLALEEFFGSNGYQPAELVREHAGAGPSLWFFVPDGLLWPVHFACLAVLGLFTAGAWTRVTAPLAFVAASSYAQRAPMATFGLDQVAVFLALYLAIAPCGAVLSVDRWRAVRGARRAGRPAPEVAASSRATVATRLIQVHLCVIYTFAGLAKLKGRAWWDGTAVWKAAANLEYQSGSLLWLADYLWLAALFTHVTVLWELTFWALVWRPRLRPYVLAVGVGMHLGIGAFLGMWTFGLVMCFAYVAWVPPAWIDAALSAAAAYRGRRRSAAGSDPPGEAGLRAHVA